MKKNTSMHSYVPVSSAAILTGLVLFALFFSLIFMLPQSLGLDESQSLWQSAHSFPGGILYVVAQDVHVPLYHFLLHFYQAAFGNGIAADRLLSLAFYLPTIVLVYLLGRIAFRESIGIFAAVIFALSPFTNWYGSVIRMYSLLTLVTVANQIFFLLIAKGDPRKLTWHWTGYFISALIGIYTHYFFMFNLLVEALFFFGYRRLFPRHALRNFIICAGALIVLFSPWLWYVHSVGGLGTNTTPKILPPNTVDVANTFSNFLFGFQTNAVNTVILSSWPLLTLFVFLALRRNKSVSPEAAFFLIASFMPIGLAATLSYAWEPFYLSRYFMGIFPAFCILLVWFLSIYPRFTSSLAKTVLVCSMTFFLYVQMANPATPVKEDYRSVSQYISKNATGRDIVAVSTPFTIYPIEYYYSGDADLTTLPTWNRLQSGPIPEYSTSTIETDSEDFRNYETLWLILSYDQGYEQPLRIYFDTHYERISMMNFSPGIDLYVYKLRYDDATLSNTLVIAKSILPGTPNVGASNTGAINAGSAGTGIKILRGNSRGGSAAAR